MDNLLTDARAAKRAGLSYGQWKAMQKPSEIKPALKIGENRCTCVWCGKEFVQRDKRPRKYCGDYCRYEASYARKYSAKKKVRAENDLR